MIKQKNELIIIPQYFFPTYGGLQNFTYRLYRSLKKFYNGDITFIVPGPEEGRETVKQKLDGGIKIIRIGGKRKTFWKKATKLSKNLNIRKILIIGLEYETLIDDQLNLIKELSNFGKEIFLRIATSKDFFDVIYGREARLKKISNVKKIIAINPEIKKEINGCNKYNISCRYIPNLLDLQRFANDSQKKGLVFQKRLGVKEKEFIALWTGRLDPIKHLEDLIDIWNRSKIKGTLFIVGIDCYLGKKYLKKIKKLVENKNIQNIRFIGPFNEKDMPMIYKIADIFLFTSYREGFCNSILEACCSGMHIICYDVPGTRIVLKYYDPKYFTLIKLGNKKKFINKLRERYFIWQNNKKNEKPSLSSIKKYLSPETIATQYYETLFGKENE
ncbi:glycosyltransferase [Candidatus Woesearchaeota archaeon]|nr:glycosyltransferase [Candidatus Woesearchaeota archaeon]